MPKTLTLFMPAHWPAAVILAIVSSLAVSWFSGVNWQGLIAVPLLAGSLVFGALFALSRYDAHLVARMSNASSFAWEVRMNGVKIGLITDSQYAAMQRSVYGDGRLLVAQVLNMGRVVVNLAGKVFVGAPLLLFWLLAAASIATPQSLADAVRGWHAADLAAQAEALRVLFNLGALVSVLSVSIMFAMGYRFGFRNHYGEALAGMLRRRCDVPAVGDVDLYKVDRLDEVHQAHA